MFVRLVRPKRGSQFLTASPLQRRYVVPDHAPDNVSGDALICMAQHIANIGNVFPGNCRMASFQVSCQVSIVLRNDFDVSLHEPLFFPIGLVRIEVEISQHLPDVFNRFNDVNQAWNRRTGGHQKTCRADASIRCRNTLWRLSRVMMSVSRPRMSEVRSRTSIRSNRLNLPRSQ
jgi:hypothetical protein